MSILSNIKSPEDVKALSPQQLSELAEEIRREIIAVTSKKGGHVSPNLGIVELSIALHRVFSTPKDKIFFDVSHQCYTHKLLTGRNNEKFEGLRQTDGISGFCNRFESEHDAFGAGHAGTAASAALGFAAARDRNGTDENIVAVLGDAALTNGVTFEAFNNIATTTKRMIVVLNDNEMSIAKNVGAIAKYLNEVITNPRNNRLYSDMNAFVKNLFGEPAAKFTEKVARDAKGFILPSSFFEYFGFMYLGPIDGHDIPLLEKYLNYCKRSTKPILLHVLTKKGKGLDAAVRNPEKFHGATPYDIVTGESTSNSDKSVPNYQDAMGKTLLKLAQKDPKIVGITAAMASGTGLSFLKKDLPAQFFDVGIAEEHAAVFAAGMACQGFRPVAAIPSFPSCSIVASRMVFKDAWSEICTIPIFFFSPPWESALPAEEPPEEVFPLSPQPARIAVHSKSARISAAIFFMLCSPLQYVWGSPCIPCQSGWLSGSRRANAPCSSARSSGLPCRAPRPSRMRFP